MATVKIETDPSESNGRVRRGDLYLWSSGAEGRVLVEVTRVTRDRKAATVMSPFDIPEAWQMVWPLPFPASFQHVITAGSSTPWR